MRTPTTTRARLYLVVVFAMLAFALLACGEPDWRPANRPWEKQPISRDTKEYFCTKFSLPATHPVCNPEKEVYANDLIPIVEQRFPENQILYSEVSEVLSGYPFSIDESKPPGGPVTSRTYEYLLTEFDGVCMRFSIRDLQTGIVSRVYPVWDEMCGPARGHPGLTRPWYFRPTPVRSPAP